MWKSDDCVKAGADGRRASASVIGTLNEALPGAVVSSRKAGGTCVLPAMRWGR